MKHFNYPPEKSCFVPIKGHLLKTDISHVEISNINGKWKNLEKLSGYPYLEDNSDKRSPKSMKLLDCYFDTGNEMNLVLLSNFYREYFEKLYGSTIRIAQDKLPITTGNSVFRTLDDFIFRFSYYGRVKFKSKIGFVHKWKGIFRTRLYFGMNIFCQIISTIVPQVNSILFFLKQV